MPQIIYKELFLVISHYFKRSSTNIVGGTRGLGETIVGLSTFGRLLDCQLLWTQPKIHYTEYYEANFENVENNKHIASSDTVEFRKHMITADASKHTLGSAMLQPEDSGEWEPVAYTSRKMTEGEPRYGQIE